MTWLVQWNGKEYDVDPSEFTGLELSEIKIRIGQTFTQLLRGIPEFEPDVIRVLFWTVDRRTSPDLKFSEYAGPPMKIVVPELDAFTDRMGELGKSRRPNQTTETDGSPGSSSDMDGSPGPTTTE